MNFVSPATGYWFLAIFAIAITGFTYVFTRRQNYLSTEGFLLANRKVGWVLGGFSIASSWIWAPALFVSVQTAYEQGLAGIFWFTLPNICALLIFAFFAPKIRAKLPMGYTFTQYIKYRLESERVHRIFLLPYLFYQLMAVVVQLFAGGSLLSLLTGIPLTTVMPILAIMVLIYTSISGFQASIITDFVQLGLIYGIGAIILTLVFTTVGGAQAIVPGLHGIQNVKNILDPGVAFSFGIVTSIGLLAGSISDQSNWQRAWAIKETQVVKAFIFGAILFGLVPIGLSVLGFIAANPNLNILLPANTDVSMIGVQTVATLLPAWAVSLFVIMLIAGLSSALDAGLSAASSLWVIDLIKPTNDQEAVVSARKAMIIFTLLGLLVSLISLHIPGFGLKQLWWVFNTIAACIAMPTILSLYWNNLSEKGVFWGVLTSFIIGIPLFIYSNIVNNPAWVVGSSLFIISLSTMFCVAMPRKKCSK